MNKVLRMLTVLSLLVCFGFSEEVVSETPAITVSGEISSEKGIQVEINGDLFNSSIIKSPLYDPTGQKMRS